MSKVAAKKRLIVERVAAYLMQFGLNETGIRTLGRAAQTSDRMLIYYFGTKDALLNEAIVAISEGLTDQLDALFGTQARSSAELLHQLTDPAILPVFKPAIQLWFELVGLAVRGKEPYATNAQQLATRWVEWIRDRTDGLSPADAKDLFAHVEGRLMLMLLEAPQA